MKTHKKHLIRRAFRKCRRIALWGISFPISLLLTFLFPFYKIKFISLFSDRIGHYALNTELQICYLSEIKERHKRTKYIFYLSEGPICNLQLHNMWKRKIFIAPFPVLLSQINFCMSTLLKSYYNEDSMFWQSARIGQDFMGYLEKYPPQLNFTQDEKKHGLELLRDLGIPIGSKWVCLLVRDGAYLNHYLPSIDWTHHSFRDCNIDNFEKAALFLANEGYYVLRMGKKVAKRFDAKHEKIIDYANYSSRSDFGDIYLTANCSFFISTSSGLDGVAQIFRKPILLVNVAPFRRVLAYWYPHELFITKKVYSKIKNSHLSFDEVDVYNLEKGDVTKQLLDFGCVIEENTSDELLDVVFEMKEYVENKDIKQKNNLFHEMLKRKHVLSMVQDREMLKEYPEKFYIKMGRKFCEENSFLFGKKMENTSDSYI